MLLWEPPRWEGSSVSLVVKTRIFSPILCQYQILPVKTVWVTFNKIKELLKVFSSSFCLYSQPLFIFFAQIMGLIEPVFFCGLYCMAHPLPFLFMGGLPRGIWILGSIQNWDNVKDTVLKSLGQGGLPEVGVSLSEAGWGGWWKGRMPIKIINKGCGESDCHSPGRAGLGVPGAAPGSSRQLHTLPCGGHHGICLKTSPPDLSKATFKTLAPRHWQHIP